ncbi:MAG: sulfide/dihydroorotate dehydrogenase-like FAD/NAD-binding protein [Candidatus Omnitrophica bacterium]|nr:sulfide/dihydroorotate dehydrogenase-like FAD/NAD-binding protein [Candidatus Omnitrophota bacterium]MCB9747746.1 sulfide/dihydroorotate dehydrogenase-like FAD/NAD-binding protein [Candidatus Omnitrophota bacterium]
MKYRIISKQIVASDVKRLDIVAPSIVKHFKPGQYVSISPEEGCERIPLSIIDVDYDKKTIALIFKEVGETTRKLGQIPINESVFSILGPLGQPATIEKKGTVLCVAAGIATAQMLPIARAFKNAGNKVIGIVGAKTKKNLMLEAQMRLVCNRIFITTEDGSYERKGVVTNMIERVIEQQSVDWVYAIGSVDMIEAVTRLTAEHHIPIRVHLNPIMVDCIGVCGACRVCVDQREVLACIEGPEFDGHKIDFDYYRIRCNAYEVSQWNNEKYMFSQKRKEEGIFRKFLTGILKN